MANEALYIGVIVLVGIIATAAALSPYKFFGTEITPESLKVGMNRPVLWIFYNDSEVNSRQWYDFGARSSHVINIPLLNLLYETIVKENKDKYRVEVIGGLPGVASLMGGWEKLPYTLQNPKASITVPEEDWIRTAVLQKYGGLWVSPSVLCVKGFGDLPKDRVVAFGQDSTPMYGSAVPGFRCLWAPRPNIQMMTDWEQRCRSRLEGQLGGRQFRGDAKSDWVELCRGGAATEVRVLEEQARDAKTNKNIELEDLLAAGTGGNIPFAISQKAVYIPIPYQDLLDRRHYGWILRLSEKQIMESDLVISHLLTITQKQ
jgi:hypothetical protein